LNNSRLSSQLRHKTFVVNQTVYTGQPSCRLQSDIND